MSRFFEFLEAASQDTFCAIIRTEVAPSKFDPEQESGEDLEIIEPEGPHGLENRTSKITRLCETTSQTKFRGFS